jgi:hypothetical protein
MILWTGWLAAPKTDLYRQDNLFLADWNCRKQGRSKKRKGFLRQD